MREWVPGDVQAFDVRTGKLKWTFHVIPRDGEFGIETWKDGAHRYTGNANVWSMMSGDDEQGMVYLPTTTPNSDYFGGHRKGDGLFAESIVAVHVETGQRAWHFQAVHHGVWDYDLPAAPTLLDITVDGRRIKALAQVSKQAFTYVFDRVTGRPVWPIEERTVAASDIPGEDLSKTQPCPTRPPAFDQHRGHAAAQAAVLTNDGLRPQHRHHRVAGRDRGRAGRHSEPSGAGRIEPAGPGWAAASAGRW